MQSTAGTMVGVSVSAKDSDPSATLRYSASGLPSGMSINSSTGLISGIPKGLARDGVTVTAMDETGASGTALITWQVGGNITVDTSSGGVFFAGQTVNLPIAVHDSAPGDILTYQRPDLPPGLRLDIFDSLITGWPTAPVGQAMSTLTVNGLDGGGGDDVTGFSISGPDARGAGPVRLDLNDKCLDASGGDDVGIWTCDGSAAQNWTYASDGTLQINGRCLSVEGTGTAAGTVIGLSDCGTDASEWVNASDGQLRELRSGYCLTDPAGSTVNGTPLEITGCAGGGSRGWTPPAETVHSAAAGRCLDDSQGGTADGTTVDIYACDGLPAQNWTFEPDGTIRVNGECLEDSGNRAAIGNKVDLWTCDGSAAEQWDVTGDNNFLGVELRHGVLCASPPSMTSASNTDIVLELCGMPKTYWHAW